MPDLDWLIARPIAHRGLHDAENGVIENTASAFRAAVAGNYGIECDLQISADGEAMVHHDDALGRLTEGSGRLDAMTAAALRRVAFKATTDRMLTLGELCDLVAGRATLVIELKSRFDGDRAPRHARAAKVLAGYAGRGRGHVVRSGAGRDAARDRAEAHARDRGGKPLPPSRLAIGCRPHPSARWPISSMSLRTRPQFIAYAVKDLPAAIPLLARNSLPAAAAHLDRAQRGRPRSAQNAGQTR